MADNSTALTQEAQSTTTASFTTALTLNLIIFGAEIAIFTVLRPRFKGVYEPRTFIPSPDRRISQLTGNFLLWPLSIWRANWEKIRHYNGLDAYMFVKYLRMMVRVFLPIWLLSWLVLFPVTSVNTQVEGKEGLDKLTFGNVAANRQSRYAAHLIMAYIFTAWIMYNVKKEMREFVEMRQMHLVDAQHSSTAQARTVLITGIPHRFLNEHALAQLFSYLPGGVQKIWLNRDLKNLPDLYDRRLAATGKLEKAETKLISIALKLRREHETAVRKGKASADEKKFEFGTEDINPDDLVPREMRPTHRLPVGKIPFSLPFMGKKVDTIEWCRKEIAETTRELEDGREVMKAEILKAKMTPGTAARNWKDLHFPPLSSAFICFNQQIAAHMAQQVLTHHMPYRMAGRLIEVAPADVIWSNLGMNPYESRIRTYISYAATGGLIFAWSIPVVFVGILTNVAGLCKKYHWLAWMCTLPKPIIGVISGVLPPVGLAVLMMLLPIVLRLLARFEGIPRKTGIELSLMTRFFIFQVIHGFLIVTLASGLISALPKLLDNPTSIPSILAEELPKASTFFITYAMLQGLAGTAAGFLKIVPLVLHYLKLFVLSSTPRSVYKLHYDLPDVQWGTLFPTITLLSVISIAYSIISPVISGFAVVTFFLFYMMYKYLFLYQLDQPASGDTGGLFFPKAINHTLVGCYIQQICLCALFFLARNEQGNASAIPQGALMVILIVITFMFQTILNNSYGPLLTPLPLTLAHMSYGMPRTSSQQDVHIGEDGDEGDGDSATADGTRVSAETEKRLHHDDLEMHEGGSALPPPAGQQPIKDNERPFNPNVGTHDEGKHNDEPADFDHPAAVEPQRIVWIPVDQLGFGESETRACQDAGVLAGSENATMDEKGHVQVQGHPPGATGNPFSGRG